MGTESNAELWAALARFVCNKPTRQERKTFLAHFQLHNGKAARRKLENLIIDEWRKRHDSRTRPTVPSPPGEKMPPKHRETRRNDVLRESATRIRRHDKSA